MSFTAPATKWCLSAKWKTAFLSLTSCHRLGPNSSYRTPVFSLSYTGLFIGKFYVCLCICIYIYKYIKMAELLGRKPSQSGFAPSFLQQEVHDHFPEIKTLGTSCCSTELQCNAMSHCRLSICVPHSLKILEVFLNLFLLVFLHQAVKRKLDLHQE